jgi:ABC-2 type transport system permease protein
MFLVACALSAMGIFLASRIKSMEAHQAVMQLLIFPMVFLSGIFFPVNNLPLWMSVLVKLNPATYGIDPIRHLVLGAEPSASLGISIFGHTMSVGEDLMIVAAFGVVMVVLAMWSFGTQE